MYSHEMDLIKDTDTMVVHNPSPTWAMPAVPSNHQNRAGGILCRSWNGRLPTHGARPEAESMSGQCAA